MKEYFPNVCSRIITVQINLELLNNYEMWTLSARHFFTLVEIRWTQVKQFRNNISHCKHKDLNSMAPDSLHSNMPLFLGWIFSYTNYLISGPLLTAFSFTSASTLSWTTGSRAPSRCCTLPVSGFQWPEGKTQAGWSLSSRRISHLFPVLFNL